MMSIAKVISMAMAELLIVVLKASGRRGRTYVIPKTISEEIFIVTGSRCVGDDDRHVDDVEGHHVKVGVGVLPNGEGRRCYSGL